ASCPTALHPDKSAMTISIRLRAGLIADPPNQPTRTSRPTPKCEEKVLVGGGPIGALRPSLRSYQRQNASLCLGPPNIVMEPSRLELFAIWRGWPTRPESISFSGRGPMATAE